MNDRRLSTHWLGAKWLRLLSTTRKYVIFIVILLAVWLFLVIKLLLPSVRQTSEIQSQISNGNRKMAILTSKLNDLETTSRNDIVRLADRYLQAIPKTNNYLALFDGIKLIANISGVEISNIELVPGLIDSSESQKQGQQYNQLSVKVDISGGFDGIKQMILRLESSLPIIKVSELSFDSKISSSSATLAGVDVSLTLLSYWSGLPDFLPKVSSPLIKLKQEDYDFYKQLDNYQLLPVSGVSNQEGDKVIVGRDNPFPI